MNQGAPQAGHPVFAYAGAAAGRQYEAWREQFCRRFGQLDVEPTATERIDCTVEVNRVGSLSFGAAHGTSGSFLRTRSLLSDGCDDLVLVTAVTGEALSVQRGSTLELRQSQMCLLSMDDIALCGLRDGGRFTALRVPRRELLAIAPGSEDKLCRPLPGVPGLGDIVTGYFALCVRNAAGLDAVSQNTMARQMTELVGLLLCAERDKPLPALRDGYGGARLQLVQAQALDHLSDGDLSTASAARRAGLTPKQVQRLFEPTGITFAEFVLEQRLLLARRLLSGPGGCREKIGSIAQDAGFGDLSYFNRTFRRRFGMTPSEWRDAQPDRA